MKHPHTLRRPLALLLALLLVAALFASIPTVASAASEGDWEYEVYWDEALLVGYHGRDAHVSVPAAMGEYPVTALGENLFRDNADLVSITLPEGVLRISDNAFCNCTSLKTVILPDSLSVLDSGVFKGCSALTEISLSADLYAIGSSCFQNCTALQRIDLPSELEFIGEDAFAGCTALREIMLPDGLFEIAPGAFRNCTSLEQITVSIGLQLIEEGAFSGCTALNRVVYLGSTAQRERMDIQDENEPLEQAYWQTLIWGDLNGDTTVNAADALIVLQYSVRLVTLEEMLLLSADVNQDEAVNASDALLILQLSVKLIRWLPVEDYELEDALDASDFRNVRADLQTTEVYEQEDPLTYSRTYRFDGNKLEITDQPEDEPAHPMYYYLNEKEECRFIFYEELAEEYWEQTDPDSIGDNRSGLEPFAFYQLDPTCFVRSGSNSFTVRKDMIDWMAPIFLGLDPLYYDEDEEELLDDEDLEDAPDAWQMYDSMKLTVADGKLASVTVVSRFTVDDETVVTTQVLTLSEYGEQAVTLPQTRPFFSFPSLLDLFGPQPALSDGDALVLTGYVNGLNRAEGIIYVCDNDGSAALLCEEIPDDVDVGSVLAITAVVTVEGPLVQLRAVQVEAFDQGLDMINYTVQTLADCGPDYAGETVDFEYLTLIEKDPAAGKVTVEAFDGSRYSLDYLPAEADTVSRLLEGTTAGQVITLSNMAVSLDAEGRFILKLMDHAVCEKANGVFVPTWEITVDRGVSLQDVLSRVDVLNYADGVLSKGSAIDMHLIDNDYNSAQSGTYRVRLAGDGNEGVLLVHVAFPPHTPAFADSQIRGLGYYTDAFDVTVGMPSQGTVNALVIPIVLSDVELPQDYKTRLEAAFNGTAADTGWQSLHTYYDLASGGKLDLRATVLDAYDLGLPYQMSYDYDELGDYSSLDDMAMDRALSHYDSQIDYTQYDANNDGAVDCVYLVYMAPYSYTSDLWWAYTSFYSPALSPEYDGKILSSYIWMSYEFFAEDEDLLFINTETAIHETGHALGLNDYYDTTYNGAGFGSGTMMDNNVGEMDPFSKAALGWIDPIVSMAVSEDIVLRPYSQSGDAVFFARDYNGTCFGEFFVVEYYTPDGLNEMRAGQAAGLPDFRGVRVMHVDASLIDRPADADLVWDLTRYTNDDPDHPLITTVRKNGGVGVFTGKDLLQIGDSLTPTWYDGTPCGFTFTVVATNDDMATLRVVY